ncbi:hypothetical protein E2562_034772 [Oryza meyeriana var. granulata]|uniref:Uncharacterized protein n=1 Tax=Oryza meyeriana var. granulata TaxID=110450 RepID=A0A6G1CKN8_9ORYZ|nr:hypothetical protein E2562_034772 [Oryza meyeriana var. granulata]
MSLATVVWSIDWNLIRASDRTEVRKGVKSRTDSTGEALHRLTDLQVESMESRARMEEQERA